MACGNNQVSSCGMEMTSKTKKDCCSKSGHSKSKKKRKAVQVNAVKDYVTETHLLIRL
jgi:hypothetical protein